MRLLERARKCSPASGNSDRCQRSRTEAPWHFRSTRRGTLYPKVVGVRHTRIRRCSTRPRQISQDAQWHPMMRDDPMAVRSTGHPAQCIDRGKPSEATPCSRGRSHERARRTSPCLRVAPARSAAFYACSKTASRRGRSGDAWRQRRGHRRSGRQSHRSSCGAGHRTRVLMRRHIQRLGEVAHAPGIDLGAHYAQQEVHDAG